MVNPVIKTLATTAKPPKLTTSKKTGDATTATGDPRGWKPYIAWCVAYYIFPYGNGVNVNQDISENASVNSDALALDINYYGSKLATQYGYEWQWVTPAEVQTLKTVRDLEELVIAHLTDPAVSATGDGS